MNRILDDHPMMRLSISIDELDYLFTDINSKTDDYPFKKGLTDIGRVVGFIEIPEEVDNELLEALGNPAEKDVPPHVIAKYLYNKFVEEYHPTPAEDANYRTGMYAALALSDAYESGVHETVEDTMSEVVSAYVNSAIDCAYEAEAEYGKLPDKSVIHDMFIKLHEHDFDE